MKIKVIVKNNIRCAAVSDDKKIITDVQSALDVLMSAIHEAGTGNIILDKQSVTEDFLFSAQALQVKYCKNMLITEDGSQFTAIIPIIQVSRLKHLFMKAIRDVMCFLPIRRSRQ